MIQTFTRTITALIACLLLLTCSNTAIGQNPPPAIDHTPIKLAPRGKPINIIANIDGKGRAISTVTLYFRQSKDASPVSSAMTSTAVGSYYGTIPSSFVSSKGVIEYYIEAANDQGEWSETNYHIVKIADPAAAGGTPPPRAVQVEPSGQVPPSQPGIKKNRSWLWPTVLIGGGALAVAGAVALADSGSSGGGNDNNNSGGGGDTGGGDTGGGGTPTPISELVLTRLATGSLNSVGVFPADQIVDISAELGTRKVESVRIELNLDPIDSFEETMEVLFAGSTVIDTGPTIVPRTFTATANGTDPFVTLRVNASRAGDQGLNTYSWSANVTFFLAE
jgi:hypothetical protein